jgi:hypothetical protein
MHTIAYILAAVAVVGALVSTMAAMPLMQAQNDTAIGNETEVLPPLTGNDTIPVTNATEEPVSTPSEPEVLTEAGGGPFNITASQVPDEATIIVTLASLTGGNNTTVIEPDGNITEIPDVNVTVVDNDTIVIAPPTENVTTIPENNVTVITPAPEPCGCPAENVTAAEPLVPVIVRPAPGQQVTIEGGEVTVQNETGVVVEGTDNQTEPVVPLTPEPQPIPEGNDTGSVQPTASSIAFGSWIQRTV